MSSYGMYENSMSARPNDELKALIGRTVTVYRGGPESKTGKLLDVQSDYLALLNENEASIVYYVLHHVQSISENAKANSMPSFSANNAAIEPVRASSFYELLNGLVFNNIKVNQGGPESKQGALLAVNDDHIVLFTEDDGVVFYHLHHIKSIYVQMKKEGAAETTGEGAEVPKEEAKVEEITDDQPTEKTADGSPYDQAILSYVNTPNFSALFNYLTHTWVSINRGGPEAVEGILVSGGSGYYTVVNRDEIIRMNPNHIKSISCGPKGAFQAVNDKAANEQQSRQPTKEEQKAEGKADKEAKKEEAKEKERNPKMYDEKTKKSKKKLK
ncbi:spore coat protein CotH [Anoxybacillus sp. J5B_2022]|nr:spore coat protein CotH [Anoxybacillus sp. J5B_2022]MCZ0755904.1 spore coat protein CotH [Anoxybacillus sp. J5B_2022]